MIRRQSHEYAVARLIGLARFREAMHAISPTRLAPMELDIRYTFNYAMAEWGETGTPLATFSSV